MILNVNLEDLAKSRPITVTEELAKLDPLFTLGTSLTQDFILQLPKIRKKSKSNNRRTELKILSTDYIPKPEFFERQKNVIKINFIFAQ